MSTLDRPIRVFALDRHLDVHGVSGTGIVAYGVELPTGLVVMRWLGDKPSTVLWVSLAHAEEIHGHNGATTIVPLTAPYPNDLLPTLQAAVAFVQDAFIATAGLKPFLREIASQTVQVQS